MFTAVTKAQALAEHMADDLYAPVFFIIEGRAYAGTSALKDLATRDCNRVGVFIGVDIAHGIYVFETDLFKPVELICKAFFRRSLPAGGHARYHYRRHEQRKQRFHFSFHRFFLSGARPRRKTRTVSFICLSRRGCGHTRR